MRFKPIIPQVVLWVAVSLMFIFLMGGAEDFNAGVRRAFPVILGQIILVYLNVSLLLPKFFHSKRYFWYMLLVLVATMVVTYFAQELGDLIRPTSDLYNRRRNGGHRPHSRSFQTAMFFFKMFPYWLAIALSSFYKITTIANEREKETAQLLSEKLETEMKFLKSQINPHFLFNILNNIYTLAVIKSDQTPDYLLKLSDILRYFLYDCSAERVPLQKEITYLHNYIDLQLLKDKNLRVEVDFAPSPTDLMIAPMLFIPFIENAFKHSSIEDLENGWIKIDLKMEGKKVIFEVKNSLLLQKNTSKDKIGGIGLQNVRRQLEVYYPDRHQLSIQTLENQFVVRLEIEL